MDDTPKLQVLVVDDGKVTATLLAALIRVPGHEILAVCDTESVFAACARVHPDVILLDVGMPNVSSREIAQGIRAESQPNQAPVLIAVGRDSEEDKRSSLEAGFDYYIAKPIDDGRVAELLGAIAQRRFSE
jgi:DNA-binding response OmpR family regulator